LLHKVATGTVVDEIVTALHQGQLSGLRQAYDLYGAAVYGWILREIPSKALAEAILVTTFRAAANKIADFDVCKCSFLTWLIQLAIKEIQRRTGRQQLTFLSSLASH
jgi:DNA-directed RNA polymerase specialized sigma24 family protein